MMNNRVIHTPEGFRDLYGDTMKSKVMLMDSIRSVFEKYSYQNIETPTIEYFDVFSSDIGTTPTNELYKFFDRDGNTLVLRSDFTPSVARAVSMHFPEEAMPARLCYEGSTFINSAELQGRLKEATQMGVEFIGVESAEADAEIIALTCEIILAAGIREFQVSVGEVDFFKAIAESTGLDFEKIENIRKLISNKNFFGVGELLDESCLDAGLKEALENLPQLFGGAEVIDTAEKYAFGPREKKAIRRLRDIHYLMRERGLDKYVSYDFGYLSKYNYYTGIIFSAVTLGTGEPIAKGGRYDSLLGNFGKDYPAVGVGIYIDQMMNAISRQGRSPLM
jgi:ATP phosphoribosyltransferase regulatory subunit